MTTRVIATGAITHTPTGRTITTIRTKNGTAGRTTTKTGQPDDPPTSRIRQGLPDRKRTR